MSMTILWNLQKRCLRMCAAGQCSPIAPAAVYAVIGLSLALFAPLFIQAADKTLTAAEAKDHVGERATICGVAASIHYAAQSRGMPTFINVDKPYPDQVFTILIWGEDLVKFDKPANWEGKRVCATGTITLYRGSPEIVARTSKQIAIGGSK